MPAVKRFSLILLILAFAAMSGAAHAAEWALYEGSEKKGNVQIVQRDGLSFAAIDQMIRALGFSPDNVSGGFTVSYAGKKLEFWSGSNVARINGAVYTFPANIYPDGGHWWGELAAATRAIEQFLRSLGRTENLRLAGSGEASPSGRQTGAIAPPVAVSASGNEAIITGIRWGLQSDSYRAVVDISSEVPVTLREGLGSMEVVFPGATSLVSGVQNSGWPQLTVEPKRESGAAVMVFTHNAQRVKGFWLSGPPRYVVDFYFAAGSSTPQSTPPAADNKSKINTTPAADPSPVDSPKAANGKSLVVIDAGHGGHDPGAVGNGLREKDINLKATLQLADRLRRQGVDVQLTRADDRYLKLAERTAIANNTNASIFISLHCNALPKGQHATGMELYLMAEPTDKDAMNLALFENRELSGQGQDGAEAAAAADARTQLLLKILGDMQQNDKISESTFMAEYLYNRSKAAGILPRKVRQAPFFVLRGAGMPAVLVEMGYISEKKDADLLNSEAYRGKMMDSIAAGILDYLNRTQKGGR